RSIVRASPPPRRRFTSLRRVRLHNQCNAPLRHLCDWRRSIRGVVGVIACAGLSAAADPLPQPILYALFKHAPDAVIARGNGVCYQYRIDSYEDGVVGRAARSERRYTGIRFDGRGNVDLDRGTLAFFYKPLEEPNAEEWNPIA